MKKNNLWRIIWIVGIYAVLALILYLIILYKVQWENADLNKYLYFYNCNDSVCTSDIGRSNYYSKIVCEDNICPYIDNINDNILILDNGNKKWLYNYVTGKNIDIQYYNYELINNNYYIITTDLGKQGIIDSEGNVIVSSDFDSIIDFKNDYLIYKENDKLKIKNISSDTNINGEYEKALLINDKYFAYFDNDLYYIASYETANQVNGVGYDYIYPAEDVILVFYNNKIDILDDNLKTTLIMNIPTFYNYKVEKEIDSLNIHKFDTIIFFDVITNENTYIRYKYDLKNKRII